MFTLEIMPYGFHSKSAENVTRNHTLLASTKYIDSSSQRQKMIGKKALQRYHKKTHIHTHKINEKKQRAMNGKWNRNYGRG